MQIVRWYLNYWEAVIISHSVVHSHLYLSQGNNLVITRLSNNHGPQSPWSTLANAVRLCGGATSAETY